MADINQARDYGVRILPTTVAPGQSYWRCVSVRHLTPAENRGRHHIFVNVFDAAGNRDRTPALRVHWEWGGQRPGEQSPPVPLDKRDGETGHADIPMEKGQIIMIHIAGDGSPSEAVEGLHAMHNDEGPGNTWGHHSFVVEFQEAIAQIGGPVEPPTEPGPGSALAARVETLERRMVRLEAWAGSFEGEF